MKGRGGAAAGPRPRRRTGAGGRGGLPPPPAPPAARLSPVWLQLPLVWQPRPRVLTATRLSCSCLMLPPKEPTAARRRSPRALATRASTTLPQSREPDSAAGLTGAADRWNSSGKGRRYWGCMDQIAMKLRGRSTHKTALGSPLSLSPSLSLVAAALPATGRRRRRCRPGRHLRRAGRPGRTGLRERGWPACARCPAPPAARGPACAAQWQGRGGEWAGIDRRSAGAGRRAAPEAASGSSRAGLTPATPWLKRSSGARRAPLRPARAASARRRLQGSTHLYRPLISRYCSTTDCTT